MNSPQPRSIYHRFQIEPDPPDPTDIKQLRERMPVISRHCTDDEVLIWGRALARAYQKETK